MSPHPVASRASLALVLALSACHRGGGADVAPPPPPPPTRPADVLLQAHLGQPRTTLGTAGRVAQIGLLALADPVTMMGVDGNIAAVVDATRPVDVLVTGTMDHPEYAIVLSPANQHAMRDTLNSGYRITTSPGLGDLLEPRAPRRPTQLFCAIVGVPATMPARIVCASRAETLQHAGRYAAFASLPLADDHTDLRADVDVAAARAVLLPQAHQALDSTTRALSVSAATARREHDRAPDFGDPEAVIASITTMGRELDLDAADLRTFVTRMSLSPASAMVEIDTGVSASGPSAIAHDAAARIGQPTTHALASRLAPDSAFAVASHSLAADRIALWNNGVTSIVSVFGPRLGDPAAATRDLQALFGNLGDEFAFGGSMQDGAPEGIALLSTSDGGAGARAALTAMATSVWLRSALTTASLPLPTFVDGVLTFSAAPPAPPPAAHPAHGAHAPAAPAPGTAPPVPPPVTPSIALGVVGDVLALVISANPATTMAAIGPRAAGPLPSVLASVPAGSVQGGVDLSHAGPGAPPGALALTYNVTRDGDVLTGHTRISAPTSMITGLARLFQAGAIPGTTP